MILMGSCQDSREVLRHGSQLSMPQASIKGFDAVDLECRKESLPLHDMMAVP